MIFGTKRSDIFKGKIYTTKDYFDIPRFKTKTDVEKTESGMKDCFRVVDEVNGSWIS